MPTCIAYNRTGHRCTRQRPLRSPPGSPHLLLCPNHRHEHMTHVAEGADVHPEGRCIIAIPDGRGDYSWCPGVVVPGGFYCADHEADAARRRATFDPGHDPRLLGGLMGHGDAWLLAARLMPAGAPPYVGLLPADMPELGRLAHDTQNVHTGMVNTQTNEGIARLCAVAVPPDQDTLRVVLYAFAAQTSDPYHHIKLVTADVEKWYNTARCRVDLTEPPDHLYKRTLDGLVAKIMGHESAEMRLELQQRLYQEANESLGMCCDGHLARLANVLVGYDDAFRPPVSQGELIQIRIAAIAAIPGISAEERRRQANAFFDEIALPEAARAVWLDVLVE